MRSCWSLGGTGTILSDVGGNDRSIAYGINDAGELFGACAVSEPSVLLDSVLWAIGRRGDWARPSSWPGQGSSRFTDKLSAPIAIRQPITLVIRVTNSDPIFARRFFALAHRSAGQN
jgi:hypothetical protein